MKTKIEWTDQTWNPITGCTKISEGCKNCYAERMAKRLQHIDPKYKNSSDKPVIGFVGIGEYKFRIVDVPNDLPMLKLPVIRVYDEFGPTFDCCGNLKGKIDLSMLKKSGSVKIIYLKDIPEGFQGGKYTKFWFDEPDPTSKDSWEEEYILSVYKTHLELVYGTYIPIFDRINKQPEEPDIMKKVLKKMDLKI